jgi:hypothetical protein
MRTAWIIPAFSSGISSSSTSYPSYSILSKAESCCPTVVRLAWFAAGREGPAEYSTTRRQLSPRLLWFALTVVYHRHVAGHTLLRWSEMEVSGRLRAV